MSARLLWAAVWAVIVLGRPAIPFASAEDSVSARRADMVARINERIAEKQKAAGVTPGERADDAEFQRRVYLDLTGVVPTVAEAREFLDDATPDKRARLVERLLDSPAHATHLANTWRNIMLPRGFEAEQANNVAGVQNWLRGHFVNNMRYDRIVSDLIVATGGGENGPALFYAALQVKPEELAANTARIFLGVQIQCAQCHDHPYDHWKQQDFWSYAAFFARLRNSGGPNGTSSLMDLPQGEVMLPDTEEVVLPKYPGGAAPSSDALGTRRQQLSIWMASRDNPFLARAAVNWAWAHLMGRGLVEPVDDLGPNHPPSHPELMDELTNYFEEIGFDLRELFRTLTAADVYHQTSRIGDDPPPPELFARMTVKVLTPEMLYDSLARVSLRDSGESGMSGLSDPQRVAFLTRMASSGRAAWEYRSGVPQALTLMNGAESNFATDPNSSRMVQALSAPWLTDEARIETLFLAAYSRRPTLEEQTEFVTYLREGGPMGDRQKALGDVLWALLNSGEFATNH